MSGYNTIFEQLVDCSNPQPEQLVAYGLYKNAKREWAEEIFKQTGSRPTADDLARYHRSWTPTRLQGLRSEGESVLASYGEAVIQAATPDIRAEALKGTFGSAVWSSIVANALYTVILVILVLILKVAGVDILGLARTVGS